MVELRDASNPANSEQFIAPHELPELLRLLFPFVDAADVTAPPDDATTIAAVSELTGHDEEEVATALRNVRRSQLRTVIQELEKPLYAVERLGPYANDPLAEVFRQRTITSILDRPNPVAKVRKLNTVQETQGERIAHYVSMLILAMVTPGFCWLCGWGILHAALNRP